MWRRPSLCKLVWVKEWGVKRQCPAEVTNDVPGEVSDLLTSKPEDVVSAGSLGR